MTVLAALRIAIESGDVAKATAELDKLTAAGKRAEDGLKKTEGATGGLGQAMGYLKAAVGGAVAAFGIQEFLRLRDAYLRTADAVTSLNTQLILATGSAAKASVAYDQLLAVANRSRVSFTDLGSTYSSISRATQDLGISAEKTMRLTETLGKAITISGGSSQSASAAMIQLSQGLSSGTLRGEELNSIMEQTPRIARALADGLGVGIGQLREMGKEGKLTGDVVTEALLKSSEAIDQEFSKTATTVAQASTVLQNSVTDLIGKLDKLTGESGRTAKAIISLANGLNTIAELVDRLNKMPLPKILFGFGPEEGSGNALENGPPLARIAAALAKKLLPSEQETGAAYKKSFGATQDAVDEFTKAMEHDASEAEKAAAKMSAAVTKFAGASGNLTTVQAKQAAQTKLLNEYAEAVKGFAQDSEEFLKASAAVKVGLANIDKNFEKKLNPNGAKDASKAASDARAYEDAIRAGREQIELLDAEVAARRPLHEAERLSIKLKGDEAEMVQRHGASRLTELKAVNALIVARRTELQQQKDAKATMEAQFASAIALATEREKEKDTLIGQAEAVEQRVRALRQETASIGVTGTALLALADKRTDDTIVLLQNQKALIGNNPERLAEVHAIERQIRALQDEKKARSENLDARLLDDSRERSKAAVRESAGEVKRASDDMYRALTDSLFRAAEAGKGFFRSLRDSVSGMFNNLTIQPALRLAQGSFSNFGVAGGGSDPLGALMSANSGFMGGFNSLFQKFAMSGTGESLGLSFNPLGEQGATALTSLGSGIQTALPFLASIAQAAEGNYATAALSAIGTAILPGIGTVIGTVLGGFLEGDRGGPKSGGSYSTTGERLFTPDGADPLVGKIGGELGKTLTQAVTQFGGNGAGLQFGLGFDSDPEGKADNRIASFLRDASGNSVLDNTGGRDVGRDGATLQAELGTEAKRLMLAALQSSDLESGFTDVFKRLDVGTATSAQIDDLFALATQFKQLGDAASQLPGVMGTIAELTATERENLLGYAGGLDKLSTNMASYYENFFSAAEQQANAGTNLGEAFGKIGLSFDALLADSDGPRTAFRDLVEGLDLTTESGRQSYAALMALAGPMDQYVDAIDASQSAMAAIAQSIDKAFLTDAQFLAKSFKDMGMVVPATAAEFEMMVRGIDTSTESGRAMAETMLGLKGTFDATLPKVDEFSAEIERLRGAISETENEMNAIARALETVSPGAETASEGLVRMANELKALETALDGIMGNGGQSPLERLQSLIGARDGLMAARTGVAGAIEDQTIQGFQNRGDTAGAVAFLGKLEGQLWESMASAADKGAVANRIKDVFLMRMGIQASGAQSAVDKANQEAYDAAVELQKLDKEHRADQIDALKELIATTEKFKQLAQGLRDAIADLKTSDLSPLNPLEKLNTAIETFDSIMKRAFAGDTTAIGQTGGAAQALLNQSRSFYGSTEPGAELFNEVIARMDALQLGLDDGSIQSAPKPELTALEKQLEALLNIEDPIIKMKDEIVDFSGDTIKGLTAIDMALGSGVDYLQVAIVAATDAVAMQIAGMRTELRTNAQNAQDRWISLGIDLTNLSDRLEDIEAAVNGTTNAVITAADTVPTAG